MSGPITWRNVNAPSAGLEASKILDSATRNFNGSFDALGDVLRRTEAIDANNVAVGDQVATQRFLDRIGAARTPEEAAALQEDPSLLAMRQALSPSAQAATRPAAEARLAAVRQQELAGNSFTDARTDWAQAPLRDQYLAAVANNDQIGAAAILAQNPDLKNVAPLVNARNAAQNERQKTAIERAREGRAVAGEGRARESHQVSMKVQALELEDKQTTVADKASMRALGGDVDVLARAHQDARRAAGTAIAEEAGSIGDALGFVVPRNTDGSVNVDRMTSDQKTEFNSYLKGVGKPTLDSITGGDTAAKAAALAQLRSSGKYKESDIAKADALLTSAFTTTPTGAIGNDAATIERDARIRSAVEEQNKVQFGEVATPGTRSGLMDSAIAEVNKITGKDTWRNEDWRNSVADFYSKGGLIPKKDGKPIMSADGKTPVRILPSAEAFKGIINSINQAGFRPWKGRDEMDAALQAWADNPENQTGAATLYEQDAIKRIRTADKPK